MIRLLIYLMVWGAIGYFLSQWWRRQVIPPSQNGEPSKPRRPFRAPRNPHETWVQIYETASFQEGQTVQARLQEEELECILYEQGKKDIHGNLLKGIGVAVPKSLVSHAQQIVSRIPA